VFTKLSTIGDLFSNLEKFAKAPKPAHGIAITGTPQSLQRDEMGDDCPFIGEQAAQGSM
jgi:hypothetical protein